MREAWKRDVSKSTPRGAQSKSTPENASLDGKQSAYVSYCLCSLAEIS